VFSLQESAQPKRSVVPDPKLSHDARGEPARVPLATSGKLDDPARDKFGFVISRTDGKLESGACSIDALRMAQWARRSGYGERDLASSP
jgi:hypothetical protein